MDTVLLFYPRSFPSGKRGRIPYALLYLERAIRDLGLRVAIVDEQVTPDYEGLVDGIADGLLVAGVSAMTGEQIKGGVRFSQYLRARAPRCKIVWGGWHPTLMPRQVVEQLFVDYAIVGQGEEPFRRLLTCLKAGESVRGIPGLAHSTEDGVVVEPGAPCRDIQDFPPVDYERIDLADYVFASTYSERCLGYFCTHGCPHDCAFCCVGRIYQRRWFRKPIETVLSDLVGFRARANIDSVLFDDDNFFVNRSYALSLCEGLIRSGLNLEWDTSAHAADFVKHYSDEDVALIRRAGCRQIYIGAESGDQEVLDMISKGAEVEDNLCFVELLRRHGIRTMMSTMVGFPGIPGGSDLEKTLDMLRCAKLIDPSVRARIFLYTPYPGTRMYEQALAHGFKPPESLEDWGGHTLRKFRAPWLDDRQVRMRLEVFANFYFPLYDTRFPEMVPIKRLRPAVKTLCWVFGPVARFRFRHNWLAWPIEARAFLALLRLFNKVTGRDYALGYESYLG